MNDLSDGDKYMVNIHTDIETLKQDVPAGNVIEITSRNREKGLKVTADTAVPRWHGERMDNSVAVDMLLECE